MKKFVAMLFIIMGVVLTGCQRIAYESEMIVDATITDMDYKSSYTILYPMYNSTTKTTSLIPIYHDAEYNVTITYDGLSITIDDQTLYESVKLEDTIQVILYRAYDDEKNLILRQIRLTE